MIIREIIVAVMALVFLVCIAIVVKTAISNPDKTSSLKPIDKK